MLEIIKPGLNIDWVGKRKLFFTLSSIAIGVSICILVANFFTRGDPVNYGTDFKGGSEIQVMLSKKTDVGQIRAALDKGGLKGAQVLEIRDQNAPNQFMLRLREVTAFAENEQKKVQSALKNNFQNKLLRFDYVMGSDKVYLKFAKQFKVDTTQIEKSFAVGHVEAQQVQLFGKSEDNVYEVILAGMDQEIRKIFEASLGAGIVKDVPSVEAVGAKMGKELRDAGIKSVIYSLLLILLYIALRFDFRYAPGAVIALLHDVIITTGVVALLWKEFSMTGVAALLTLAGYSINDTIVVYDRIRENVARYRDRKFPQIVNTSINETLSRTILTSLTTFFTSATMWLLTSGEISAFAFMFSFGIIIGTYSSIAVASPLTLWFNAKFNRKVAVS